MMNADKPLGIQGVSVENPGAKKIEIPDHVSALVDPRNCEASIREKYLIFS